VLSVLGFFLPETGIGTSLFELIDEKEWSLPVVFTQRGMFREIPCTFWNEAGDFFVIALVMRFSQTAIRECGRSQVPHTFLE
jgi:hypothetical protein